MWILNYAREANNYALDSHPYNEDVLIAIEVLAQTESGLPTENLWEWKPDHYIWEVAGHSVAFQRILVPPQTLFIIAIQPEE